MKNLDIRTLCGACKSDYESSGYVLSKIKGQSHKDECDFCQVRKGWEYKVTEKGNRL